MAVFGVEPVSAVRGTRDLALIAYCRGARAEIAGL
jgi:hypothetical protein